MFTSCSFNCFLIFLFAIMTATTSAMELAVTVDGIPAHGDLPSHVTRMDVANQMIKAFKKHHLPPVYGMVVGNLVIEANSGNQVLKRWLATSNKLGNHTYSHPNLDAVDAKTYIDEIEKTNKLLSTVVPDNSYKYFRYPYLSKGNTPEKKAAVKKYLNNHGYQIAPVTMDYTDYLWNEAYLRCARKDNKPAIEWLKKAYIQDAMNVLRMSHMLSKTLFGRDISYILLMHMGAFEALMLDDLLSAYEREGVRFVTLPKALSDTAYQSHADIIQKVGYPLSFKKYSVENKLTYPLLVDKINKARPIKKLNQICKNSR